MHKGPCRVLLLAVMACLMSFSTFGAESAGIPQSGEDLLPYLQMVVSFFNSTTSPSAKPLLRQQETDFLWTVGLIAGVYEGIRVQAYRDGMDVSCTDLRTSSNGVIAQDAINYIRSHPEAKSMRPVPLLYKSVITAYPCILRRARKSG
jgi:hypothetical protein